MQPAEMQIGPEAPACLATRPTSISFSGWKDVLLRTWNETSDDNVSLMAAGVAFYGFLAMVPLLGSIVLSYGLVAEPATVVANVRALTAVMPAEAAKLIGEQLLNVVTASGAKTGVGLLLALALALYGAMKGAGAIITALNVAYDEKETRGFIKLNLITLGITVSAVFVAVAVTVATAALGHLDQLVSGTPGFLLIVGKVASYVVLAGVGAAAAAALYRYGPDRDQARWRWLTPGSIVATSAWLALTIGFGTYVANFGSYDATYGSLGAVVVLLTWLYLSAFILITGAELNAELEHQTAADTTVGPERPMGRRGAEMADSVASDQATMSQHAVTRDQTISDANYAQADSHPVHLPDRSKSSGLAGEATALLTIGLGSRAATTMGLPALGMAPLALATFGFKMLKTKGRFRTGASFVAVAATIALLQRDPDGHHRS